MRTGMTYAVRSGKVLQELEIKEVHFNKVVKKTGNTEVVVPRHVETSLRMALYKREPRYRKRFLK